MDPLIQTAVEHRIGYLQRRHARMKRLCLALRDHCNEQAAEIAALIKTLPKQTPRHTGATNQEK